MPRQLAPFHLMLLRVAVGVLMGIWIGALYGLFIGVAHYPLTHIGLDYEHPGPLIPNTVEWAWIATEFAAFVAGVFGFVVVFSAVLLGTRRKTAAIIGFVSGLILLPILYIPLPKQLVASSLRFTLGFLVGLVLYPVGLTLLSLLVASISIKFKRWGL
jgi:hypothetical protein